jgi:hypothetical protein
MNKYLRNLFIASKIDPLLRIAYKDLRKKFRARHHDFQEETKAKLFPDSPPKILSGPFAGNLYLDEIIWGSITPRWVGSYEHELWGVIDEIVQTPYKTVIDVGCAEGYYATGLATQLPDAKIFAYDLDPFSREQCARLRELNNCTSNLEILPWCDHAELKKRTSGKTLLVIDIEGGEMAFLDPEEEETLRSLDILVEVHRTGENVMTNTKILQDRFQETHEITLISSESKHDPTNYNLPEQLDSDPKLFHEGRAYDQTWIWMKAH